jgi:hypothetical protein
MRSAHASEYTTFKHSTVNMGSVVRSTLRMAAAGLPIEQLELKEPMHRTLAFAAAGSGIGHMECLMNERKNKQRER